MLNIFVVLSTLIFLFFAFIWKRDNFLNLFFKLLFSCMSIFGILLIIKYKIFDLIWNML